MDDTGETHLTPRESPHTPSIWAVLRDEPSDSLKFRVTGCSNPPLSVHLRTIHDGYGEDLSRVAGCLSILVARRLGRLGPATTPSTQASCEVYTPRCVVEDWRPPQGQRNSRSSIEQAAVLTVLLNPCTHTYLDSKKSSSSMFLRVSRSRANARLDVFEQYSITWSS